jgi:hypothetical protein
MEMHSKMTLPVSLHMKAEHDSYPVSEKRIGHASLMKRGMKIFTNKSLKGIHLNKTKNSYARQRTNARGAEKI